MTTTITGTIILHRGTAAVWTSKNRLLAAGEMGLETDTHLFKVGDGVTLWNSLPYWNTTGMLNEGTLASILAINPAGLRRGVCALATDVNNGTLYSVQLISGSNAWAPASAGVGQIGGTEIVGAHPAAGPTAGIYPTISPGTATTGIARHLIIPQLTPSSFTMPSRPVMATMHIAAGIISNRLATYWIGMEFTINAGTNWHTFVQQPIVIPTGGAFNSGPVVGYLPTGSATSGRIVAAGNTVQVRGFIMMTPTRSITDGVTNGTTLLTSATAAWTQNDVGKTLVGGTVNGKTISVVSSGTNVTMSATVTSGSGVSTAISDTFALVAGDDFFGDTEGNYWPYLTVESI